MQRVSIIKNNHWFNILDRRSSSFDWVIKTTKSNSIWKSKLLEWTKPHPNNRKCILPYPGFLFLKIQNKIPDATQITITAATTPIGITQGAERRISSMLFNAGNKVSWEKWKVANEFACLTTQLENEHFGALLSQNGTKNTITFMFKSNFMSSNTAGPLLCCMVIFSEGDI